MRHKGFTLIELLVVIAIIAILAAILFPVLSRARLKALQASCLSNSKQIVLAIKMYAVDNDEYFPSAGPGYWTASMNDPRVWYLVLESYLDEPRLVGKCPANSADIGYVLCCRGTGNLTPQRRLASCAILADGPGVVYGNGAGFQQSTNQYWNPPPCGGGRYNTVNPIHNGGANVGYADGHSKWHKAVPYTGTAYYYIPSSRWY